MPWEKQCTATEKIFQVTGIIKNRPENSDIKIDALLFFDFSKTTAWMDDFDNYTFVLFYKKPDFKQFQHKLVDLSRKYIQPELDAGGGPGGASRGDIRRLI